MVSETVVQWLKEETEPYIYPITKFLGRLHIHPHILTLFSFISGILATFFLFENHLLFILFALLHLFFDIFDGHVARYLRLESSFGAQVDRAVDRAVAFALLTKTVAMMMPSFWWFPLLFVLN